MANENVVIITEETETEFEEVETENKLMKFVKNNKKAIGVAAGVAFVTVGIVVACKLKASKLNTVIAEAIESEMATDIIEDAVEAIEF